MPEVRWCIHESIPRAYLDFSYPGYISAQVVPYFTISVSLLACVAPRTKPLDTCSGHDALMWKPRRQDPRHLVAAHLICCFVVDKLEARNVFTTWPGICKHARWISRLSSRENGQLIIISDCPSPAIKTFRDGQLPQPANLHSKFYHC